MDARAQGALWRLYVPKLVTTLRAGYGLADLRADALAGLTVAVVALPLAMALAIASGASPEQGLHTAIVAGFLISALGGSRVQIGGPTAAFIPVVFAVIAEHGYGGLLLATMMAGVILVVAGLLRVAQLMKFVPQPVITGFTAGIAVSIALSQVRDLLGLPIAELPAEFVQRLAVYAEHGADFNPAAVLVAAGCLALIVVLRRWRPRWPGFLLAVVAGSLAALVLPVSTIGSTFGELPAALPALALPPIELASLSALLPAAFTIAFLAGIESLLSATVADGMTGGRHRGNCELVAQGVANLGSALVGGLPATGAIARTATNIRAGARTPVAGMMHAVFLLVFMLALAPLMRYVPMAALAAVLLVVAWNMSEAERFRHLMRAPPGDRVVLLVTFVLTVAVDLTVAIEVGVAMAALLFMQRMSTVLAVERDVTLPPDEVDDLGRPAEPDQRSQLPPEVAAFRVSGPLFFAVADRVAQLVELPAESPRVLILRLGQVPLVDASAATALASVLDRSARRGVAVILSGLAAQPREVLEAMGLTRHPALLAVCEDFDAARARAREWLAAGATPAHGDSAPGPG